MSTQTLNQAVLGGGCFWCLEAYYQRLPGVTKVVSGYAGGSTPNPTYKQVCNKDTGHAEVVEITFDSSETSYSEMLEQFWNVHDPTTKNRQGGDEGPQYRSIILGLDDEQVEIANKAIKEAQPKFKQPIVTEVVKLEKFWPAETEHQDYYNRNKFAPYCMFVISPKLKKLGK